MMKIVYVGSLPEVLINMPSGESKKVKKGDVIELPKSEAIGLLGPNFVRQEDPEPIVAEAGNLKKGDEVEVLDGEKKGLEGIVQEVDNLSRPKKNNKKKKKTGGKQA